MWSGFFNSSKTTTGDSKVGSKNEQKNLPDPQDPKAQYDLGFEYLVGENGKKQDIDRAEKLMQPLVARLKNTHCFIHNKTYGEIGSTVVFMTSHEIALRTFDLLAEYGKESFEIHPYNLIAKLIDMPAPVESATATVVPVPAAPNNTPACVKQ